METLFEWAQMNGYARYVWGSYAIATILFVGMIIGTLQGYRSARKELEILESVGRRRDRGAS